MCRAPDRLQGAGLYYGAGSTEALSCKDEEIFIVGGANSAGQAALNFAGYARKVYHARTRRVFSGNDVEVPDR